MILSATVAAVWKGDSRAMFALKAAEALAQERDVWARLADLGPSIAALLALIGVGITLLQKSRTDSRAQWWARVHWAADRSASEEDDMRAIGMAALVALATDRNKDKADLELLAAIADARLVDATISRPDLTAEDVEFEIQDD